MRSRKYAVRTNGLRRLLIWLFLTLLHISDPISLHVVRPFVQNGVYK